LETDLYPPIKRYLERLGLEVKGEVCGCDLIALSDGSPELVVIGEMKQSFTLELVLQAVDRTSVCDEVWLAVGASKRGRGRENDARASARRPAGAHYPYRRELRPPGAERRRRPSDSRVFSSAHTPVRPAVVTVRTSMPPTRTPDMRRSMLESAAPRVPK